MVCKSVVFVWRRKTSKEAGCQFPTENGQSTTRDVSSKLATQCGELAHKSQNQPGRTADSNSSIKPRMSVRAVDIEGYFGVHVLVHAQQVQMRLGQFPFDSEYSGGKIHEDTKVSVRV